MKCLVTKLKASLDIENPIYFRAISLWIVNNSDDKGLALYTTAGSSVKVICPKEVTLTSDNSVVYENKTYTNEYTLEAGKEHTVTFAVSGAETGYQVDIVNIEGIRRLATSSPASSIKALDVRNIRYCLALESVGVANFFGLTAIKGTLSDISTSPVLSQISGGNSCLGGTLESMAENQWNTGARSKLVILAQLGNKGQNVTFHGQLVEKNKSYRIVLSTNDVQIQDHDQSDVVMGTYDGSTWTYA